MVETSKETEDPKIQETVAVMLDQVDSQHTRLCLEAERSLGRLQQFHIPTAVKAILEELCNIRHNLRRCKALQDTLQIKELIKERRHANQRLIWAYKNQWKVETSRNRRKIKILESLEPCGKMAARSQKQDASHRKLKGMYRKISFFTGKRKETEGIKLQSNGQWVHDPEDKLHTIVQHNKEHFMQAKGCSFSQPKLQGVVDPSATEFDGDTFSELEKEFIKELRRQSLPSIPEKVDWSDWRQKFKTWRETTRTSPSGVHLGHFKSLLSKIYKVGEGQCDIDTDILSGQQVLFEATLTIVNLAIESEMPLTRWKTAINMVIPKKKDIYDAKNLRNIHIYECDLNA